MAFYNGGKGAGASQAWRHIQLIEVPGGQAPVEEWVRDIKFDRQGESVPLIVLTVQTSQWYTPLSRISTSLTRFHRGRATSLPRS